MVQSMPDASPVRWHLAHSTWFFETFLLEQRPGYRVFDPAFRVLFNSYYNQVGSQFPRPQRGLISRPGLKETLAYRHYVDEQVQALLESGEATDDQALAHILESGLNHEQQHQELILTDILHAFSCNPLLPAVFDLPFAATGGASGIAGSLQYDAGLFEAGHADDVFCFDNEQPRHQVFVDGFELDRRPVSCGQFIEFINDGGYRRPDHWLSMGWDAVRQYGWEAPLYWLEREGKWFVFTLAGLAEVEPDWPVTHVSYFEADAIARWAGRRLPTEFEWERASADGSHEDCQFADSLLKERSAIHSTGQTSNKGENRLLDIFGGAWEWTSSSYAPYPGYQPPPGAMGEYNGKFMCNQYVLRGGSVATSRSHIRATYRNFFPPEARWQFSGLRLAR